MQSTFGAVRCQLSVVSCCRFIREDAPAVLTHSLWFMGKDQDVGTYRFAVSHAVA